MFRLIKKRWWFAAVLLIIILSAALALSGKSPLPAQAATVDDNYFFKSVDTEIYVNRDKTFDITETLSVEFNESGINTGIIRDIQHQSKTTRIVNGKKKVGRRYLAYLSNVNVTLDGEPAKVTQSLYGAFHAVKMQSADGGYLSAGVHTFVLNYTYDMGDDKALGFDDFTFDVLGYAMADVEKFTAKIIFPDGADLSEVSFRTNDKAEWMPSDADGEYAEVVGNEIRISANPKAANKGYTVQVILPDGYFSQSVTFYWYYLLFIGLAAAGIAACVVLAVWGRIHKKSVAVVELYPPEDMTVMRFSAVWHNGARYKDIGALILKWAADGLVEIQADGKRHFKLIPDKCLYDEDMRSAVCDAMSYSERSFFESVMFSAGQPRTFSSKEFKKLKEVYKYRTYEDAKRLVEKADRPQPYAVSAEALSIAIAFLSLIPTVALYIYYCVLVQAWIFLVFLIFAAAGTFVGIKFNESKGIFLFIFSLAFYGGLYFCYVYVFAYTVYDYAGLFVIAPLWWVIGVFVLPCFTRGIRTKKIQKEYERVYGFREFLLYAELDRIQMMFDENPDYFAKILPYCYIMGISKKVQKRFASLNFITPAYLDAGVTPEAIGNCVSHSFHHSPVSFMGDGGGGGGGSSGGGGGGGSSGGGGGGGGSRGC